MSVSVRAFDVLRVSARDSGPDRDRVAVELADLAKIESNPTMEGKSMTMILAPK